MSLVGKLVTEVELNSSGDAVFDIIAHKPNQLVNSFPDIIQGCDLLDGVWGALGCVIFVNYTQGKFTYFKSLIFSFPFKIFSFLL